MKPSNPDDDFLDLTDVGLETADERVAANALRDALDARSLEGDAGLLGSLKAAHSPNAIDEAAHRAIVERALAPSAAVRAPKRAPARGQVIRVAFGASALAAIAAAVLFAVKGPNADEVVAPFVARSTQALFDEKFEMGQTTARVDRIAAVRAAEFRENQFARWGVR